MSFENNNFDSFFTEFQGLQPPERYVQNKEIKIDNVDSSEFLNNLDKLNTYSNFSDISLEFPGLQPPSMQTNIPTLDFNNLNFKIISFKDNKKDNSSKVILKGNKQFEEAFAEACKINPSVVNYKNFLTKIAKLESGFNSHIQNRSGAPYYGYFQMGKEEIKRTTGLTVEQFRNNPVQQILGAVRLYNNYIKTVKAIGIYDLCKEKGFSDDAIAAGAWAGGPGGVKKFIKGLGDPSDSHWYKKAGIQGGTSVGKRMKEFNT